MSQVTKKNIIKVFIQVISISRAIASLAFITIAMASSDTYLPIFLYSIACLSDFADGYLARRFSVETSGGKALDLFGDKYLTIISSVYAIMREMPIVACGIIISKEVFLLAIRMVHLNGKPILPPQRTIGGLTVFVIWVTTGFLILTPSKLLFSLSFFEFFYWFAASAALLNILYKLYTNWEQFIRAFR